MTDILIPLGKGSRHGDIEIRYCLRSIEKHLNGVGNIFIVGECPEWVTGIIHIPATDNQNNWNRARNIYRKIIAGIRYEGAQDVSARMEGREGVSLSDNFLFMNDDHFLLADYEAAAFPYYHRGAIQLHRIPNEPQRKQMENTCDRYPDKIIDDYDVHCPILYNKRIFTNLFSRLPEKWPEFGYGIKSYYANGLLPDSILCDDLKFSEPLLADTIHGVLHGRKWFSIGDRCLKNGEMQKVLEGLYSEKSKYEN